MSQWLVLEMSGQTWHVPFETLHTVPRVGESIRLGTGKSGVVKEVAYEFAPEAPPVELAREMPANVSYARAVRVVIKV